MEVLTRIRTKQIPPISLHISINKARIGANTTLITNANQYHLHSFIQLKLVYGYQISVHEAVNRAVPEQL